MTADTTAARKLYFAACREVGLAEDVRHLMQERVTGKASTSDMGARDFIKLMDELKERHGWKPRPRQPKRAGDRPLAAHPQAAKMRALWLALYHLGYVRNPAEDALAAFVKRQTGVAALQWVTSAQANKVIEALKDRCRLEGFTVPADELAAKRELVRAIWRKLATVGAVRIADDFALDNWFQWKVSPHKTGLSLLSPEQLDQAAEKLGAWLRGVLKKTKEAS